MSNPFRVYQRIGIHHDKSAYIRTHDSQYGKVVCVRYFCEFFNIDYEKEYDRLFPADLDRENDEEGLPFENYLNAEERAAYVGENSFPSYVVSVPLEHWGQGGVDFPRYQKDIQATHFVTLRIKD